MDIYNGVQISARDNTCVGWGKAAFLCKSHKVRGSTFNCDVSKLKLYLFFMVGGWGKGTFCMLQFGPSMWGVEVILAHIFRIWVLFGN